MVQQVFNMLPKELFDLRPGTFIKGIRLIDYNPLEGRCASLNVKEWISDVKWSRDCQGTKNYTLLTPWYANPTLKPMNGQQAYEKLVSIHSLSFSEQQNLDVVIPDEQFNCVEWTKFEYDDPIGIHLGMFFIFPNSESVQATIVYSKLLRSDGEVGYIALIAQNINKDLELL